MRLNKVAISKVIVCASSICVFSYACNKMISSKTINEDKNETLTELFEFQPNLEKRKQFPIVYNTNYDIGFWSIERYHPFDTRKWGKIHERLLNYFEKHHIELTTISPKRFINDNELSLVHSKKFIQNIYTSSMIANAAEIWFLRIVPSFMLNRILLQPLKWQTAGSVLAAHQALKHGWGINLGGGFHHASMHSAEGFCLFADISLIMKILWETMDEKLKFMIIDLDAHQGNGYARDLFTFPTYLQENVYILDAFNPSIFPDDGFAQAMIHKKVQLKQGIEDYDFLKIIERNVIEAMAEFKPDLIIYNAGTDILKGDPLGNMNISSEGILFRDQLVFQTAKDSNVPIVMLTSGGYQHSNAEIIADSIINLHNKKLIY